MDVVTYELRLPQHPHSPICRPNAMDCDEGKKESWQVKKRRDNYVYLYISHLLLLLLVKTHKFAQPENLFSVFCVCSLTGNTQPDIPGKPLTA